MTKKDFPDFFPYQISLSSFLASLWIDRKNLFDKLIKNEQFGFWASGSFKTRQVYNLFQDLWNKFLGFFQRNLKKLPKKFENGGTV